MAAGVTYEPIASQTLSVAAATITFSSIPSTYTDLRLVFNGNYSAASRYLTLTFNADSGSNYSNVNMGGDSTGMFSYNRTSATVLYTNGITGVDISIPQLVTTDIFSYANSAYKTTLSVVANDKNGSGSVDANVGLWRSTSAITSITLQYTSGGGTINVGSIATLYGIKAA